MTTGNENEQKLRIEIWIKENMEWSLEGEGSGDQFKTAAIRLRSLFADEENLKLVKNKKDVSNIPKDRALSIIKNNLSGNNLMICDENFRRMMVFFYLSKVE